MCCFSAFVMQPELISPFQLLMSMDLHEASYSHTWMGCLMVHTGPCVSAGQDQAHRPEGKLRCIWKGGLRRAAAFSAAPAPSVVVFLRQHDTEGSTQADLKQSWGNLGIYKKWGGVSKSGSVCYCIYPTDHILPKGRTFSGWPTPVEPLSNASNTNYSPK